MSDRYLEQQRFTERMAELEMMLDDYGTPTVLWQIAKDCQARADASRTHPYTSVQWAKRAKALAQLAAAMQGEM